MEVYQFVKSQKGKEKMAYRGNIYRHTKSIKNSHYFRCEDESCNGTAILQGVPSFNSLGGFVSERQPHVHVPLVGRLERLQSLNEIKNKAKESTSAPAAILQQVRQNIDSNVAIAMPSAPAVRQIIHRFRKKGLPVEPADVQNLVIPDNLKVDRKGKENFLLFDRQIQNNDKVERILMFGTSASLKRLAGSEIWYLDGTFKTAPQLFKQLYTIHFTFQNATFPAIYVLMTGMSHDNYMHMLDGLVSAAEDRGIRLSPKYLMVDFELASINALKLKFPTAQVSGCLFHLGQNIYRKIQKTGLVAAYNNNDDTSLYLRQLSALAFLPPGEIPEAFQALSSEAPEEIQPVFRYFSDFYVVGIPEKKRRRGRSSRNDQRCPPRFPPSLWSIHHLQANNLPRTNNGLEAWHRRFETVVERYHLGVFSTINEFIKENHRVDQEIERIIAGNSRPKKRKENIQREERLASVLSRYGSVPILHYLKGIAHNLHYSFRSNMEEENNE